MDLKFEQLCEFFTKIENILTHWSVAKAGWNDEKNWRSKISLKCPKLFTVVHLHMSYCKRCVDLLGIHYNPDFVGEKNPKVLARFPV